METTAAKYAVKSAVYPQGRELIVDGPWSPTVEAAVSSYAEVRARQGLAQKLFCKPTLVEKCDPSMASYRDPQGAYCRADKARTAEVATRLVSLGLSVRAA